MKRSLFAGMVAVIGFLAVDAGAAEKVFAPGSKLPAKALTPIRLPRSDLAVSNVTLRAVGDGRYSFKATVTNIGIETTTADRAYTVTGLLDPRLDGREGNIKTTSFRIKSGDVSRLKPGQSMTIEVRFSRSETFGSINVRIQIASGDLNSANDTGSATILVRRKV